MALSLISLASAVRPTSHSAHDEYARLVIPASATSLSAGTRRGSVLVGGRRGDRVLQGAQRLRLVVAVVHEDTAEGPAGGDRELRGVGAGREAGQTVGDIEGDVVLGAQQVHAEDPVQRLEQLGEVADPVAEGERPPVDVLDLRRAVAACCHQWGTEADEQGQLDLVALATLGQVR